MLLCRYFHGFILTKQVSTNYSCKFHVGIHVGIFMVLFSRNKFLLTIRVSSM